MKKLFTYFVILLFLFPTVVAEEEYEEFGEDFENAVKKIEDYAKKIQDLIKKYEDKKLPVIKAEDVTITDQDGNGVACEFNAYYDNAIAIKLQTSQNYQS
ncbi:MAG: hypothetical protein ACE5FT_08025 [Candidatus Nanoarchaeia archaeon]